MKTGIKLLSAALVVGALLIACSDEGNLSPKPPGGNNMDYNSDVWGICYIDEGKPQNGVWVELQVWCIPPGGDDWIWWPAYMTITPTDPSDYEGSYYMVDDSHILHGRKVRLHAFYWKPYPPEYWSKTTYSWTWYDSNNYIMYLQLEKEE